MGSIIRFKLATLDIKNYEVWLEKKAEEGLKLRRKFLGFHIFKRGKGEKVKYFLDLNDFPNNVYSAKRRMIDVKDVEQGIIDYEELYKNIGWELVWKRKSEWGHGISFHLWKKGCSEEEPETINDYDSLIKYNKNIMCISNFLIVTSVWTLNMFLSEKYYNNYFFIALILFLILCGVYGTTIRLKNNRKYKNLKLEKEFKG
ncbi:Protein of unknown function [Clostridium cavendishii DSM 21758]|uniref:DUF2812 domain-containing protein n=1 Tax=Clostridium cavendishii DSM 21758 TaxID=1121302 RepID=A0A1M6PKL9_9CLOT|nr:DUF2812 domain-containing protein [Clostridium cavendishii]SHK08532.1 Protein of unknown function [Clostridium cavendishii DSM 21758]